jgi:hypothetical protein
MDSRQGRSAWLGFAFLPAREVQRLSCVSGTRCTFYIQWDGKLDNHKAQ